MLLRQVSSIASECCVYALLHASPTALLWFILELSSCLRVSFVILPFTVPTIVCQGVQCFVFSSTGVPTRRVSTSSVCSNRDRFVLFGRSFWLRCNWIELTESFGVPESCLC